MAALPPTSQPQQTASSNAQPSNKSKESDDPVSKLKSSISLLKEVVTSLFEQASVVVQLQSSGEPVDTADGKITLEQQNIKFAKALEEFHHTCDILETNIMVARTAYIQAYESTKFTSNPDLPTSDLPPHVYSDYLSHVRSQVTATKEVHDLLQDFSRNLSE
ncbi:mediator of RNA polymerase II transcription subunit 29-like [Dendronephthya gigantea]|uniref:mediator of RNA polymerase II transcription subunit 29-like n=1 Tax=Dendronephthya gigantea TaxID=151771 RepID=UPI00106A5A7C|nr:mediator of RNA polymerase II transcription subunit 29-like [Dendronephthya gigantea]